MSENVNFDLPIMLNGACEKIPPALWRALENSSVLVTGATGLVGFNLVAALLLNVGNVSNPPVVYALVRNAEIAAKRFSGLPTARLRLVEGDVLNPFNYDFSPDYIIHAAAITDSDSMTSSPVSVIETTLQGTKNVLEFARTTLPKKMIYISSMEVYGAADETDLLDEHTYGTVDPLQIRSSYPESKKMAENFCCAYASQFKVKVCIARLAQTFGPGIPAGDSRVFSYFMRCVRLDKDIELQTSGESSRMYVATADAVSAFVYLLNHGKAGEAYNIANKDTYCTIREMAELVCERFADNRIKIRYLTTNVNKYPPVHHLKLDTNSIEKLGWSPKYSLIDMLTSILNET